MKLNPILGDILLYKAMRRRINRQTIAGDIKMLRSFISLSQITATIEATFGEEKSWFFSKIRELAKLIRTMPKSYESDGLGDKAIIFLHYFKGGANWYITEQDSGDLTDRIQGVQNEAFGLADLYDDGGALGYISIAELIKNGVELDYHWTPISLGEMKYNKKHGITT